MFELFVFCDLLSLNTELPESLFKNKDVMLGFDLSCITYLDAFKQCTKAHIYTQTHADTNKINFYLFSILK